MHCNGNLEARNLVSVAIIDSRFPGSCGSVGVEATDFSVCMHENYGYIKPNTTVGKSSYKWKTMDTFGKTRVGQGLLC
jgi:hypothetical protein